jgi:photosystem II stability/assembly factor-like uncharacterized protein
MNRSSSRLRASGWALGLVLALATLAGAQQQPSGRDKTIDDILKTLEELRKQVEDLKKGGTGAATSARPSGPEGTLPAEWVKALKWRSIGPAGMGGRITAISVYEADPSIYWVATASGGLLKTENNGITFTHQFDKEATVSIGDVCVAPSDKNVVYVGTGEANPRNSVSYGDGVYKSTDGGKTWKNVGLKKAFQIGRVLVHPKDPNVVYVGVLGRLYGPSDERGLYKTTNGGETWEKVLYVDDKTGVIDIAMHPTEPDTMVVAMWERQRDGFDSHRGEPPLQDGYDAYDPIKKWGKGSGLHKTTDGGKTWKKLTKGLPASELGRIDVDYYRKDPNVLFAIVDCAKIGMGTPPSKVYMGIQGEDAKDKEGKDAAKITAVTKDGPAEKAGLKVGDLVKSAEKKAIAKYSEVAALTRDRKAGDKVTLEVLREDKTQEITISLEDRPYGVLERNLGGTSSLFLLLGALGVDEEKGVRVRNVFDNRNADKAGIIEDDLIVEIDGKAVTKGEEIAERIRKGKEGDKVPLKVQRDNETKAITLTLLPLEYSNPNRPHDFMYGGQAANVQDRQGPESFEYGGIYKSTDGGESWSRINSLNPRPMYFSQIRVDPSDEKYLYALGVSLHRSKDGGQTFTDDGSNGVHPDQHALWIDPKDGRHMIVGCDGGFYVTYDRMENWEHLNHMAIGQFYHVALDSKHPYRVFGGLQDNATWGGPSRSLDGSGPLNTDWIFISGGDGFVCRVDPFDADLVYFESQDGNIGRRNLRTGERGNIRATRKKGERPYFNWNTPFILSSHNSGIFYAGGNKVYRSLSQGDRLEPISPAIGRLGRGTASALAESPRDHNVLWAGTDDGNLWISRDGGREWTEISKNVGLPGPRWVATIEPSRHADGRCYVAFDGHRSDDDEPYAYVTEDFGKTWKSVRGNLPTGSTRCLREDLKNQDLLVCGTEFAVFASVDRGQSWTRINANLPTVAVHELAIHPTTGEMVAATHGRSLWVLDITPLRQMNAEGVKAAAKLYEPNTVVRWRAEPSRGNIYGSGAKGFRGEDPPRGAQVVYSLGKKAEKASLKVMDVTGKILRELPNVKTEPGLYVASWDLLIQPPGQGQGQGQGQGRGQGQRGGGGGGGGAAAAQGEGPVLVAVGGPGRSALPGTYRVVLTVDGQEFTQPLRVEADPSLPAGTIAADIFTQGQEEDEGPEQVEEEARRLIGRTIIDD